MLWDDQVLRRRLRTSLPGWGSAKIPYRSQGRLCPIQRRLNSLQAGTVFAVERIDNAVFFLCSLSMEISYVVNMFATMDIGSLRSPRREMRVGNPFSRPCDGQVIVSLTMRESFLSSWEAQDMTEKNEDPPYCGYKGERWQPVHHQRYFVILGDGGIRVFRWSGAPFDYAAWQFGNCFKTRRAAERAREAVRQVLGVFHIERER